MNMNDIKLFAKNEKELETLIHAVRIYSQDIGMEFDVENCAMLVMKSSKRYMTDGIELPNHDKIRTLGEKETWASWKLTSSDKWKWKTRFKKNISGELENHLRQNSPAETSSKE